MRAQEIFCSLKHDGSLCFSLECKMKQKITLVDALTLMGRGQRGKQMETISDILGTVE